MVFINDVMKFKYSYIVIIIQYVVAMKLIISMSATPVEHIK